jgi:hypothetical protein
MAEEVVIMVDGYINIISGTLDKTLSTLPGIFGALIILIIGWLLGRFLGRGVRILLKKLSENSRIKDLEIHGIVKKSGVSVGYLGDIVVRLIVYLFAILAAVDVLNLDYLSRMIAGIIAFIPHICAFVIILLVGFILSDYFIDLLEKYLSEAKVGLIGPVLILFRPLIYFFVIVLALGQLMLDLTIIYTVVTPIAWGVGLGIGATIAIFSWYSIKIRGEVTIERMNGLVRNEE